jgi:hypothetical protein
MRLRPARIGEMQPISFARLVRRQEILYDGGLYFLQDFERQASSRHHLARRPHNRTSRSVPDQTGHALIIPRAHHPYFDDLPELTASRIIHLGQRLARVMKPLLTVTRVALLFTGGDHPHVHALAGTP